MENRASLVRLARRLRLVVLGAAVAVPALALAAFLAPEGTVTVGDGALPFRLAVGIALVSACLLAAGFLSLARMLRAVGGSDGPFTSGATRHFRRFARFLLLSALAGQILPIAAQLVLIAMSERRQLVLGLSDQDILILIVAALLFLVSRLFDEAARLDQDSRSII